ncbi:MAG: YaaR family protein [Clostridiales bacterium]|jgi:uncharacterized protein YaaR (DUF327 family)|nr:YaaR family protein [Clostridiales bacterium]
MSVRISQPAPVNASALRPERRRATEADFNFTLNRLDDEGLAQRLSNLLGDITVQGKRLAEHMDIKDMRHYRSLVSDFMHEVITRSHEFTRENFLDRRGRHRVYGIVRLVDEKLDELARELIRSEKDHIDILDRVDEIKGLILDMIA